MFESIGRSWNLMKESFGVLSKDKELLVFPAISGAIGFVLLLSFLAPFLVVNDFSESIWFYPYLFVFYFISYFVVILFNSALIGAAMIRLNGGDPTINDGLAAAKKNLVSIVGWAVIAATVGLILRMLTSNSKDNILARIAISIVGGVWTLITFFVVPVIVMEGIGPVEAIKKSGSIVKEKLGETVLSQVGFGLFSFIGYVVLILFGVGLTFGLGAVAGFGGFVFGAVIGLALLMGFTIIMGALDGIYVAALYYYASTGKMPDVFSHNLLPVSNKGEELKKV